jgi:hypothetical protein
MKKNETPAQASARINALFKTLPKGSGAAIANANATARTEKKKPVKGKN